MNEMSDAHSGLMPQQSDVRTSASIAALAEALANAQMKMEMPDKDRTVTVQSEKGRYTFAYATMDNIVATTRPALCAEGLSVIQPLIVLGAKTILVTRLLHKSGEWIESTIEVRAERPGAQALGSAITYMRRYAYSAMLGIVTDDDDDGNSADGHTVTDRKDKPRPPAGSMREEAQRLTGKTAPPPQARGASKPEVIPLVGPDGQEYMIGIAKDKTPAQFNWHARFKGALERLGTPEAVEAWFTANKPHLDLVARHWPEVAEEAVKAKDERAELLDFPGDRPSR